KNWHWGQMVLLLGIVLFGVLALFLSAEVLRVHRAQRQGIARLEKQVADLEAANAALRTGTRDTSVANRIFPEGVPFDMQEEGRMPALSTWNQRLQILSRQRGRVWRGVRGGQVAPTGSVQVQIAAPKPHNLEPNSIVYAFEEGEPNEGAQYLGEFRVTAVNADGAELQSVFRLDNRTGNRINQSQRPWSLYETMPADRHELFANLSEEELRQLLPADSVEEYVRHGSPATDDDDDFHRAGYDENGRRVGPESVGPDTEFRYDRPLRDYAYLFAELARQRVMLLADTASLTEDIDKLKTANEVAQKLSAYREQEKSDLDFDLNHMQRDRSAIETVRGAIADQLATARDLITQAIAYNAELAEMLAQRHLGSVGAGNFGVRVSVP
ncbi:MAG: hypothetical protein KDA61_10830, partial [Planctomycetales bacterium]|nr:hypothetical protein [Planctomycetales bacterium]